MTSISYTLIPEPRPSAAPAIQPAAPPVVPHIPSSAVTPYFSPVLRFDANVELLILQVRNSATGNVTHQYPATETAASPLLPKTTA